MNQPLDYLDCQQLLDEARRLLQRSAASKLRNHDELVRATEALHDKDIAGLAPTDPLVAALRAELTTSWLYEHQITLKPGSSRMTYLCVAISVLLMFVTGSLTVIYNEGVALLSEVEGLAATHPERRFGQLERQLMVAQTQLFKDKVPGENTGEPVAGDRPLDELAQESSYVVLHELRDLNLQLLSLQNRTAGFSLDASAPFPVVQQVSAKIGNLLAAFPLRQANAESVVPPEAAGGPPAQDKNKPYASMSAVFCGKSLDAKDTPPSVTVLGMKMDSVTEQACRFGLSFTSLSAPSVSLWATTIKSKIAAYSLWQLPCLYAALGAMIFFMRLILDPAQPNPPAHRIVHRMALAALAGMALGWFWDPILGKDADFNAAGVGLFTFAFVVGFSIDVFYAMLDRLVNLSTSAISRIGT